MGHLERDGVGVGRSPIRVSPKLPWATGLNHQKVGMGQGGQCLRINLIRELKAARGRKRNRI